MNLVRAGRLMCNGDCLCKTEHLGWPKKRDEEIFVSELRCEQSLQLCINYDALLNFGWWFVPAFNVSVALSPKDASWQVASHGAFLSQTSHSEGEGYWLEGTSLDTGSTSLSSCHKGKTHTWRSFAIHIVKKTKIHLVFCFPLRRVGQIVESLGSQGEATETLGDVASWSLAPTLPLYCWLHQALTDWLSWEGALVVFYRFSRQKISVLKEQCSL